MSAVRAKCGSAFFKLFFRYIFLRFVIGSEPLAGHVQTACAYSHPGALVDSQSQALLSELLGKYKDATFQRSLREANGP